MKRKFLVLGIAFFVAASLCGLIGAQSQSTPPLPAPPPQGTTGSSSSQQAPAGQGDTRSRIVVRSDLVIVPVTVKDSQGRLVGDLQKDEFRVFEDDIEQQILLFTSDPFPLSAVVVIDDDLPQKAGIQVQKSLATISAGFGPNDEVAVVTYDAFPNTVADFSFNNDQLYTLLKRLQIGSHSTSIADSPATAPGPVINGRPQGQNNGIPANGAGRYHNETDVNDALYAAGEMLKTRGRDRRKIIFLISDGSNSKNPRNSFDSTLRSLLIADVSVYSISVSHSLPIGKSLVERGAGYTDKFAINTGGDTFFGDKQEDLDRLYSDVTEEARNQYTLTFSPHGADKAQDYHTIEVRVRRPNVDIFTRHGYYQSALNIGR
jgi:VWFA-related protein